jgi:hypothetical protein
MQKNIIPLIIAAMTGIMPVAAQTTQKLSATKATEYGLTYTLPNTVVDVTLEVEHTVTKPGEFSNYANRYLGLTNVIRTADEQVRIKSATLTSRGVPNAENRWLAQFKSGTQTSMVLTQAGVPLSINEDDVALPSSPVLPQAVEAQPTALETEAARHAVTLEMTRSTSLSKKAELAAQRIFELREQRNELISGNVDNMPPDGAALQVALNALSEQEAALTAMFAGTTQTYTEVTTVTFEPTREEQQNVVLARISPVDGVVGINDMSGMPVLLTMRILSEGKLPVNEKGEEKKFPKGGVAYTIPGTAEITLTFNGKTLASSTVELAQLGCTFGIDPALFTDKKAPSYVEFSPVTGGIVKLDVISQ